MINLQEIYKIVCSEDELDILSQSNNNNLHKAERVAMEEVASYLRPRYDIDKAFAINGDKINYMLLQVTANITLYYLAHWLPGNMALDSRQSLYDNAIEWLTKVSKGVIMPDLPTYSDTKGETDVSNPIRFGSIPPSKYDY